METNKIIVLIVMVILIVLVGLLINYTNKKSKKIREERINDKSQREQLKEENPQEYEKKINEEEKEKEQIKKKNKESKNMKKLKNFIFISLGIIFILLSIKLLYEGSNEYVKIVMGICFGILFIYPSLQKESKTDSEKFIEQEDIDVPIWWKRFLGFLIDFTIIVIIYIVFVVTVGKFYGINLDVLYNPILLMSPFMVFYYVIQEFLFNTTIGKSVFKLMVISVNTGEKLTLSDVIIRTLSRFIPLDVFFFFSKRPVGLHDMISKTVVVMKI